MKNINPEESQEVQSMSAPVYKKIIVQYQNDNGADFRSDTDQRNSALSVYDTESPEIKTARTLADEIINISGAEIKVFVRTECYRSWHCK